MPLDPSDFETARGSQSAPWLLTSSQQCQWPLAAETSGARGIAGSRAEALAPS